MLKTALVYLQFLIPQHLLSAFLGWVAEWRLVSVKNGMIRLFVKHYKVDLSEAKYSDINHYETFNAFFTRELASNVRPVDANINAITSPVDGILSQYGQLQSDTLLTVKDQSISASKLIGDDGHFENGNYAIFYLSPRHYHRVHMPLTGKLVETRFIPGKLFSVNQVTSQHLPDVYLKNERLITNFETKIGKISIIMIGALIVGRIKTVWKSSPYQAYVADVEHFEPNVLLEKGEELGMFMVGGSSVILLFEKDQIQFHNLNRLADIKMGTSIGSILS